MSEINKIYNEDCLITMSRMADNFIDLIVTSPPYDNLRKYNGYFFDFEKIAVQLFRILKEGGVMVWVVNDATINGNETGTSFKQALYFKEIGFNLHDTMIWYKNNTFNFGSNYCYSQKFEYMFVFCKGRIKTCNLIKDKLNKFADLEYKQSRRSKNEGMEYDNHLQTKKISKFGKRHNVWTMPIQPFKGFNASFPEKLASDHILSWSNQNDLVYDPFMGSGTVAKACISKKRNYIGSEISEQYCNLINERLNKNNEHERT